MWCISDGTSANMQHRFWQEHLRSFRPYLGHGCGGAHGVPPPPPSRQPLSHTHTHVTSFVPFVCAASCMGEELTWMGPFSFLLFLQSPWPGLGLHALLPWYWCTRTWNAAVTTAVCSSGDSVIRMQRHDRAAQISRWRTAHGSSDEFPMEAGSGDLCLLDWLLPSFSRFGRSGLDAKFKISKLLYRMCAIHTCMEY